VYSFKMSKYKIGLFFKENVKTISMFPETRPFLKMTVAYIHRDGVGSQRKGHINRQSGHFLYYMHMCSAQHLNVGLLVIILKLPKHHVDEQTTKTSRLYSPCPQPVYVATLLSTVQVHVPSVAASVSPIQ